MEIRPAFLAQVKVCLELYMFIYLFTFILWFFAFCSQHCQGVHLHRGWKWSPARLLQKALHRWCDWRHQDFQLCSQNSGKKIENIENKFVFWGAGGYAIYVEGIGWTSSAWFPSLAALVWQFIRSALLHTVCSVPLSLVTSLFQFCSICCLLSFTSR